MKYNEKNKKKYLVIINTSGKILMAVAIIYIIIYLINSNIDFRIFLTGKMVFLTVALGLLISGGILLMALAWKKNIEMLANNALKKSEAIYIYTRSNLVKYVPGNVLHLASRNLLGSQYGLSQKGILFSSVLEILQQIIVVLLLVLIFVANSFRDTLSKVIAQGKINLEVVVLMAVGIIVILIAAIIWLIKNRKKASVKPLNLLASSGYIAGFAIINAASFVVIIVAYGVANINIFVLAGYYLLAWLLGLITPGAPGGLGIRELILIMLLLPVLQRDGILAIVVMMRVITISGDLFACLIGLIMKKISSNISLHKNGAIT